MIRRLSTRAWVVLMIGLVATASGAGLVLSLHAGSRAQPAAAAASPGPQPGSTQARADLGQMQALLNSGSVSKQAALLVPPLKFAPGSGPVFPAGTTVAIHQGTLHADGQQFGTVQASAGGKAVTLDLHSVQGHWYLIGVKTGAQTRAAVTPRPGSQPVMRLTGARIASNHVPTKDEIKARTAVILVHGWMPGSPSVWGSDSNPDSMFFAVDQLRGTWVSAFDYSPTNGEWFGNDSNGPALARYIHAVSQASLAGHGNGKVIIVAHSMGGLLARYAANQTIGDDRIADDIGMVITLGTPNTGSFWANAGDDARKILCWEQTNNAQNFQFPSDFCRDWTALAGMSVLGPQIKHLKELPPQIPLFAIAGNEILHWRLGLSVVDMPLDGDAVVSLSSALHHRPAGGTSSYTKIQNPPRVYDISAWHGDLPKNRDIIAMVHDLIRTYIATHPARVPAPAATSSPAPGGDSYWLADGGKWYVHGMTLQISRAAATSSEADLTGIWSWNDYQNTVWGHAVLRLSVQQDGSLAGTFVGSATYTLKDGSPAQGYAPQPDAPTDGQTIRLVPVAPMHAKVDGGYFGSTNWCQAGLPDASQYCGA